MTEPIHLRARLIGDMAVARTDEDFEAFCALARSNSTLDVLINYGDSQHAFSPSIHSQAQISAFPSAIVRHKIFHLY